jgi:signal transduction histidine kinase
VNSSSVQQGGSMPRKELPGKTRSFRTASWQLMLAGLVLALGLGATAWIAHSQGRQEALRVKREFQQASEQVFSRSLREIQLFMEVLDSIRQLHSLSDQVSPEAFNEIARKGMMYQRRILGAYGFAQRIPHAMRATYEKQSPEGHTVVMSDGHGSFVPVLPHEEYFLLTYQMPKDGLGIPLGYDFGSRSVDRIAIQSMEQLGVFALGGPPTGTPAGEEFYMFAPIRYGSVASAGELVGFAVGLFQPDRILTTAVGDSAQGLTVRLEPVDAAAPAPAEDPWRFDREFSLANQEWRFVSEARREYWAAERARTPELVVAIGLLISLALSGALLFMAGRARRVEALVRRRTSELAEANRKLEGVMEERRELEDEVLRISGSEKARIGRDLHDSLGQKLTGAMYLFGAYRKHLGSAAEAVESDATQIASTLKDAVTQVRRIARGLAPVALTEDGLPDALRQLAEESSALFQKDIEFYAEREGRPRDVGTAEHLYLIAQEAVNNAVKHGKGSRIILSLDFDERGGELVIEDNGRGMPAKPTDDREGGNGLRIMRHRAEVFGGELAIGPGPKNGVRVVCRFPKA